MKFMVTIELGDDAMRSPSDISYVLARLAESIRHRYTEPFGTIVREDDGILMDVNGNTVGEWKIERRR